MGKEGGHVFTGILLCWLLNVTQLGIAALLLLTGDRALPAFFILITAIGALQLAYVVPLWRLMKRHGQALTARGIVIAASITAAVNIACWAFAAPGLHFLTFRVFYFFLAVRFLYFI